MDQVKIGKFIAENRKKVNLTQIQLAERLNITNKAVSKWECGKALPDSSIMLELCKVLKITVNDLLSGEVVTVESYNNEMEGKLIELVRAKEKSDRRLLALEWVIAILSIVILFVPIIIGIAVEMEELTRIFVMLSGFIPGIIGLLFAIRIEQLAGYYECKLCQHRYVPTSFPFILSMHFGRTRYLKCPKCQKRSWQKKVLSESAESEE